MLRISVLKNNLSLECYVGNLKSMDSLWIFLVSFSKLSINMHLQRFNYFNGLTG